jgi:CRISPR-associated protein Csd2
MANANGDPLNGNRPRTDYEGYGEMSDVCIKRKIRNRMQDMGMKVFVQSDDRSDDGCDSLSKRAEKEGFKGIKKETEFFNKACTTWMDVRSFGQVFAFNNLALKSIGVRGPVSIHQAVSVVPVEIVSMQITKSVSGDKKEGASRGSDTMGMKHFVKFGMYIIKGSINVQLAEKTGFSEDDADTVKECLRTLFTNDSSSARPDGSMEVIRLYWWRHNCKDGQYSSAKVHRSVHISLKEGITVPYSWKDYQITVDKIEGLEPEVIDGV